MKLFYTYFICTLCVLLFSTSGYSQLWGDNAYMKGDYVEVAISHKGNEGADTIWADTTYHFRGGSPSVPWGFVANPQMDGWVDYNGDFFTPGTPECGFGLTYTILGVQQHKSNNYDSFDIPGEIIDYTETTDSIMVTWQGMTDSLQISLLYELKKDELFYRTTVNLNNIGPLTFTDIYYYDNFDPDNNQPIGGTFTTDNEIESQSEMADDSVIVCASQPSPWLSEIFFLAEGADWKGAVGGFSNRNGDEIWNGTGAMTTTEGYFITADQAIALAHKTDEITPGKSGAMTFSYVTAFSRDVLGSGDGGGDEPTDGISENEAIPFKLYPNPVENGAVTIQLDGVFAYTIFDASGRVVAQNTATNKVELDLDHLEKGVYLVQVEQGGNSSTERLVLK